jgi:hypothetical protein
MLSFVLVAVLFVGQKARGSSLWGVGAGVVLWSYVRDPDDEASGCCCAAAAARVLLLRLSALGVVLLLAGSPRKEGTHTSEGHLAAPLLYKYLGMSPHIPVCIKGS